MVPASMRWLPTTWIDWMVPAAGASRAGRTGGAGGRVPGGSGRVSRRCDSAVGRAGAWLPGVWAEAGTSSGAESRQATAIKAAQMRVKRPVSPL